MSNDKYIQYMKNVGGRISVGAFSEDWEPIGGAVLDSMLAKGEVVLDGLEVVLVNKQ